MDSNDKSKEVTPETRGAIDALNQALDTTSPEFVAALNAELGRDLNERNAAQTNRAQRRADARRVKRLIMPLNGNAKRLTHPLAKNHLMPWGVKAIAARRAAEKIAKKSRQINRGGGRRSTAPAGAPRTPKQVQS